MLDVDKLYLYLKKRERESSIWFNKKKYYLLYQHLLLVVIKALIEHDSWKHVHKVSQINSINKKHTRFVYNMKLYYFLLLLLYYQWFLRRTWIKNTIWTIRRIDRRQNACNGVDFFLQFCSHRCAKRCAKKYCPQFHFVNQCPQIIMIYVERLALLSWGWKSYSVFVIISPRVEGSCLLGSCLLGSCLLASSSSKTNKRKRN